MPSPCHSSALRRLFTLAVPGLVLLGAVLTPAAAHATPDGKPGDNSGGKVTQVRAESRMYLVGFDEKLARANGREIVTLPDGSLASVPADKAAAARAGTYRPASGIVPSASAATSSYGEVHGECGTSWVSLDPVGNTDATLTTGMRLSPNAGTPWDVHWHADIADTAGYSSQNYTEQDGFTGSFSWTAYARVLNLSPGWANATITWGSFALTSEAWLCYSYSPTTSTTIY
ncbi:hypothetical protein AB0H83_06190 [Dactylosporangium sp. NPDC050688]|uniref:hypothetical protein n=1 Tax=Dactylosporangium sp. NPDC050688 TaxID=3157217 RepID=UPI00340EE080